MTVRSTCERGEAPIAASLRLAALGLDQLAAELPVDELPEFFASIERAKWTARLRLTAGTGGPASTPAAGRPSMTAAEVAALFQIDIATVYRWSRGRGALSGAVRRFQGVLRFDPAAIDKLKSAERAR